MNVHLLTELSVTLSCVLDTVFFSHLFLRLVSGSAGAPSTSGSTVVKTQQQQMTVCRDNLILAGSCQWYRHRNDVDGLLCCLLGLI